MRSLVRLLMALCLALLLPAAVMAAAQAGHGPTRHACCEGASLMPHHADAATKGSLAAAESQGEPAWEHLHLSCDLHACNGIDVSRLVAERPLRLTRTVYAPASPAVSPPARAERPLRPPTHLS
ncbi:hypothetical protein [Pseudoroseicyclus tamaricis]|uniref:DUF2946 family protein n=1 Tax=Pseudoroseicyclus tamaricis TaxID=2705421 RepID=A0A6B2JHX9_9RHOB|nr:hypothetical protein [Pseudoroseicyclus tamaricis]NDV00913.1 hypothetical protein [Pseudoroseicyclus tamaricis]